MSCIFVRSEIFLIVFLLDHLWFASSHPFFGLRTVLHSVYHHSLLLVYSKSGSVERWFSFSSNPQTRYIDLT